MSLFLINQLIYFAATICETLYVSPSAVPSTILVIDSGLCIELSNETFAHLDTEVTILPSPATEVLNINSTKSNIVGVEIFNTLGESVERQHCDAIGGVVVDISNFQKGIYFVRVTTKNGSYLKKCVKI